MICSGAYRRLDNILEYSRYHNPQVRALVWSLLSPGLVRASDEFSACVSPQWCQQIYQQLQPFLEQLDNDPGLLTQWLERYRSWRLGVRFEAFWMFILERLQQQNELLCYSDHIQIQEPIKQGPFKKTLGEMDFVYMDNNHQLNHLEIAVKFYLLKPDEFGYERLVGPNGCDWYERKLLHLFKKQLPLSETPDAKEKLAEQFKLGVQQVACRQQGIIKGMIFFPVTGVGELNDHEKKCINPDCLMGSWATMDNWHLADPGQLGYWVILDKLNWLVPQVYSSLEDEWLSDGLYSAKEMAYKLKIHFHNTRRSILIARLDYDKDKKFWLEQQRLMVVDKYWPNFKRPERMQGKDIQQSAVVQENERLQGENND